MLFFKKWLEDAGHIPGGSSDYSNAENSSFSKRNDIRSKYGAKDKSAEDDDCKRDPRMGFMKRKMKKKCSK